MSVCMYVSDGFGSTVLKRSSLGKWSKDKTGQAEGLLPNTTIKANRFFDEG